MHQQAKSVYINQLKAKCSAQRASQSHSRKHSRSMTRSRSLPSPSLQGRGCMPRPRSPSTCLADRARTRPPTSRGFHGGTCTTEAPQTQEATSIRLGTLGTHWQGCPDTTRHRIIHIQRSRCSPRRCIRSPAPTFCPPRSSGS